MSLISEEERANLENLSYKELKEKGFKKVNHLKPALKKEIFYILAENPTKEAMKKLEEKGNIYSISTLRTYRKALTANNLVKKFREKIGGKNKEELLEFLRKNPSATIKDVKDAGYWNVLEFYYRGAINIAKQEAEVPKEYHYPYSLKLHKQKDFYLLKNIIYGLILSSTRPLYTDEIAAIVKCSHEKAKKILSELKVEGKIEYRKILGSFGSSGSKKFKAYKLLKESWKKFGVKKIAYDPNNINQLEFIAREISNDIKRSLGGKLTLGARKALSYRLKSLPENLKTLIKEHLYSV